MAILFDQTCDANKKDMKRADYFFLHTYYMNIYNKMNTFPRCIVLGENMGTLSKTIPEGWRKEEEEEQETAPQDP